MPNELLVVYGGFGSYFDVAILIFFLAVAVIYLVIPVMGYQPDHRNKIAAALYALIGYVGAALIQTLLTLFLIVERGGAGRGLFGGGGGDEFVIIFLLFSVLKLVLFLTAMIAFVVGLRSVRLRPTVSDMPHDG